MTVYYVSSIIGNNNNAGTSPGAPLATLQAAADLTQPGDVVEVMNGTYTNPNAGWGILTITTSGTAADPITYEAMPGQTPIINSSGSWAGIAVVGASNIIIEGFDIVGDAQSVTLAYAQSQETNLDNPTTSGGGIVVEQSSSSGPVPTNITIENNTVEYEAGGGIAVNNADYVSILNNIVFGNANWSPYADSGISVYQSEATDNTTGYHVIIAGNIVYDNQEYIPNYYTGTITDGNGIIVDSNDVYGYIGRTLIENNISLDNGGSGIHPYSSSHVDILNNTAYNNDQSSDLTYEGQIFPADSGDIDVANNITAAPDFPAITAPPAVTVGIGQSGAIAGVSLSETDSTAGESVTVTLTDRHGKLSASNGGEASLSGSGTTSLTVSGTLNQVNAALATLADTDGSTASDTITLNATDSLGNRAAQQQIAVTVQQGMAGPSGPIGPAGPTGPPGAADPTGTGPFNPTDLGYNAMTFLGGSGSPVTMALPTEAFVAHSGTNATIRNFAPSGNAGSDTLDLTALLATVPLSDLGLSTTQGYVIGNATSTADGVLCSVAYTETGSGSAYVTDLTIIGPGGEASVNLDTTSSMTASTIYQSLTLPSNA